MTGLIETKRIKIHGFKSLKDIDFEMKPLNVLIGPNNGGKTNFLEFFEFLSKAAYEELQNSIARCGGFDSLLFAGYVNSKSIEDKKISWEIDFSIPFLPDEERDFSYKVTLASEWPYSSGASIDNEWLNKNNLKERMQKQTLTPLERSLRGGLLGRSLGKPGRPLKEGELTIAQAPQDIEIHLREYIRSWAIYEFSTATNSPLRREQSLKAGVRISPTGDNLAAVLHSMKERGEYREAYNEIIKTLKVAFPTLKDLRFPCEVSEGKIALRWEGEFKREFPANVLSDGVLKFLCLTTLLLSPDPPDLICIDEPEIGLHPQLIGLVAELLTAASERTQLIVTTHSPQLIKRLKPEDVVIVEKKDGATELRRLPPEELESWLKDFTLDELWLTGVIGGR